MGPGMFNGIVEGLILIGVIIGLAIAGVVWGLSVWVFPHIHFTWS